jgi:hypothetical protein
MAAARAGATRAGSFLWFTHAKISSPQVVIYKVGSSIALLALKLKELFIYKL